MNKAKQKEISIVILRANSIVGLSKNLYSCNHVVNYALTGDKNKDDRQASDYLNYGVLVPGTTPLPMDIVVAADGSHVGIFVSKTEFIHSGQYYHLNPETGMVQVSSFDNQMVIKVGWDQLRLVFPCGYQIRRQPRKKKIGFGATICKDSIKRHV
jgi:hypothetical protein